MVKANKWKWFGRSGHFCCGEWCRFHLCTRVGRYIISTVGQFVHPRHSAGSERTEVEWLAKNPLGEEIGSGRHFETMVFRAGKPCSCGCGQPTHDGKDLDFAGYETCADARAGHRAMCNKWAKKK